MDGTMGKRISLGRLLPFALTSAIIIADQVSKTWIVANVPQGTMHASYLGDFVSIWHVRNKAIGFSLGASLPMGAKVALFIVVPLVLLVVLAVYMVKTKELTTYQRWLVAALMGGGFGNVADRMFREDWVVDFVSLRMYGLFGMERWPTFNVADSTIVVSGILLMLAILFGRHAGRQDPALSEEKEEAKHE